MVKGFWLRWLYSSLAAAIPQTVDAASLHGAIAYSPTTGIYESGAGWPAASAKYSGLQLDKGQLGRSSFLMLFRLNVLANLSVPHLPENRCMHVSSAGLAHERFSIPLDRSANVSFFRKVRNKDALRPNTMTPSQPLKGIELINCAKANAGQGIHTAAKLCGYGSDLDTFTQELNQACQDIGIEVKALTDLIAPQQKMESGSGLEIAPESLSQL